MIRLGIVEDEEIYRQQIKEYLNRFKEENNERFSMCFFENGQDFLQNYQQDFDLLILDIQLGQMDGMEVARRVRQQDDIVIILFMTAMPQYAIHGYTVDASGYMLKPISYFQFSESLRKAMIRIRRNKEGFLIINTREGMLHIPYREIRYIETQGRNVCIHTQSHQYISSIKMRELQQMLPDVQFFRCHNCYLVNLQHVESITMNDAVVGSDTVAVSRLKKAAFMEALARFGGTE